MPPADLSRVMVSQIPSPPPNDRNFDWTHKYADYCAGSGWRPGRPRTWSTPWRGALPALEPGDGTGVRLAAQEHGETGPEVAA